MIYLVKENQMTEKLKQHEQCPDCGHYGHEHGVLLGCCYIYETQHPDINNFCDCKRVRENANTN